MANHLEVEQRAAATQSWLCGRPLDLASSPDQLMSKLRVHLLTAKKHKLLKNSRDEITNDLIKKDDPITTKQYERLHLQTDAHPPKQLISIVGGEKDFKRTKQGLCFEREDGAWFDFALTLYRDEQQKLTLLAYDFEIRFRDPADADKLSFIRLDLNPPANRRVDGMRCHLHSNVDDEGLAVPAPLMTPIEILDLFIYGLRLRRAARHPRLAWPSGA